MKLKDAGLLRSMYDLLVNTKCYLLVELEGGEILLSLPGCKLCTDGRGVQVGGF